MFEVDAGQFIQALRAVGPHASDDEDSIPFFRVQVTATDKEVMMTAGSGTCYGLVRLPTSGQGEVTSLHLRPTDVPLILKAFKPAKDTYPTLRVAADGNGRVTVTERIGIGFDGRVLELPALAGTEDAPNLAATIAALMVHPAADVRPVTELYASALTAIAASATAMNEQVVWEATTENGPMLFRIGERFVGLAAARRRDEDDALRERERIRGEWLLRLPDPGVARAERLKDDTIITLIPTRDTGPEPDADQLVADAAGLVIGVQFASASMLQRKLRVGFKKAGWILGQLTDFGVIGTAENAEPFPVLVPAEKHDEVVAVIRSGGSPDDVAEVVGGQQEMDLGSDVEAPVSV